MLTYALLLWALFLPIYPGFDNADKPIQLASHLLLGVGSDALHKGGTPPPTETFYILLSGTTDKVLLSGTSDGLFLDQ